MSRWRHWWSWCGGWKDVGLKNKHWHEKCFACIECKTNLIDRPFANRDNGLYCALCYEKNPTICTGCENPFRLGRSSSCTRWYFSYANLFSSSSVLAWYDTIGEFNVDSKAECVQLNLALVARKKYEKEETKTNERLCPLSTLSQKMLQLWNGMARLL